MKKPASLSTAFATYSVGKKIGEGGNGYVYEIMDEDGESFAAKILKTPDRITKTKLKRFKNEIFFGSRHKHVNIIRVIESGLTPDGSPFLVMPLYEGSLNKLLPKLDADGAFKTYLKILDGVEAAHLLGVAHRDLMPKNILYRDNGDDLVIADFGIAHFNEEELYTAVETKPADRMANFEYAAPEQKIQGRVVTMTADIFSLGLILNELFTKEVPHGKGHKTIGEVSERYAYLDQVVDKMMQQSPEERYKSIGDVKMEIKTRGAVQISEQKLSAYKNEVVPKASVQDPLIENPIEVVGGDWDSGYLTLELNEGVTDEWHRAYERISGYQYLGGIGLNAFNFSEKVVTVRVNSRQAQAVLDFFKDWLVRANSEYKSTRIRKAEEEENERNRQHKLRIKSEEERNELLKRLKF